MRRKLHRARGICAVLAAFAAGAFCYLLWRAPVFSGGEGYEFSAGASSSAGIVRADDPVLYKLFTPVAGESARYAGNRYEALREAFSAQLLFTEEACGVVNYYLYSPRLGGGVMLGGYLVNLHIAVSAEQTAVGTPLIFGGS